MPQTQWESDLAAEKVLSVDGGSASRSTNLALSFSLGEQLYGLLERYSFPLLLLMLGLLATGAFLSSFQKHLWYDEVFTVIVANRPTWHGFYQAMPAEGNPPLNTLLTRLCLLLFGPSDLSVRLPDLLGFLCAVAGVYCFVRREVGAGLGLVAAALIAGQPAWKYSFEARPYGVLMACLALAMVSWQAATREPIGDHPRSRTLALFGMAIGILGCTFSHYIGIVEVAVPLIAGEAVRSLRRRRLDWPLLATGLVALPALAVVVPMMSRTHAAVIVHSQIWTPPLTLPKLHAYYLWAKGSWGLVLSSDLLAILCAVVLAGWVPGSLRRQRSPIDAAPVDGTGVPVHVLAAALGATLLIPITWVAMLSARGWYFCRYGIGSVLGIAILASLLLGMMRRLNKALVAFLFLAACFLFQDSLHTGVRELRMQKHADDIVLSDASELPLVIASPVDLPQIWWYAPANVKHRLVYLPYPLASAPQLDLLQATLLAEQPIFGSVVQEYASFLARTPHFLVDIGRSGEPLQSRLTDSGCQITPLRTEAIHHILDVQCGTKKRL